MILFVDKADALPAALDGIGLGAAIDAGGSLLIKVNLAHVPKPQHPRTDPALLTAVIRYARAHEAQCAFAEAADGFLGQNLEHIGLGNLIRDARVVVLDLDLQDTESVFVGGEEHFLPKCLRDFSVRVGIPATSKRPGMTFSNNVKLFVGAVPRRLYQDGDGNSNARPRIHVDLHRSVANIYRAMMAYAPFDFFINGGKAMFEDRGEIALDEILVGNNALELDFWMLDRFGVDPPDYIKNALRKDEGHR